MANKQVKSVLEKNNEIRNENLHNNGGKYNLYGKELEVIVGKKYNVYTNEKNPALFEQNPDLLRLTHGGETEYSKDTHDKYGLNSENLLYYAHSNIKPSYKVNNFDGFGDYMSYMFDTYGMEETYAGYLAGFMGVRELANSLAYDIVPDFKGKTAQDVINEILQYNSVEYAMKHNEVGIVKDINVAMAVAGQVTTNINNYSGKESKMGLISNIMYGTTLLKAASFNSMRRTNYITSDLDTLYGNNLYNVYSLSSLFRVNDETGRIPEPVTDNFITEIQNGNIFNHLLTVNPEFRLPDSGYDWSKHPNYGTGNKYYDIAKGENFEEYIIPETEDWTIRNSDRQVNKGISNDTFKVYSEGMFQGESFHPLSQQETSDGFIAEPIRNIEKSNILKKTNELLALKQAKTMISRFHDIDNVENTLTQSAVYKNFGISHGRNLLTKDSYENGTASSVVNTYTNPYCRVWTNHHQYSKMKHLIRPFINDETFASIEGLQKNWMMFRGDNGAKRLSDYTVLNKNGMVNITPTRDGVDVKKCMFSIENLAWKDVLTDAKGRYRYGVDGELMEDGENALSAEQRGPNGGRIMWFPPYDLTFQETSSAKWSENEFIGRGEPVFTYINSTRSGTLEFTILVDHPSVVNYWTMNKENTEENEQSLLRFFAGCEAIEPDADVVEQALYEVSKGETRDPAEVNAEKDIVFYTFFPNNFSGMDMSGEEAMQWLFGGQGSARKVVTPSVSINDGTPKIKLAKKTDVTLPSGGTCVFKYELVNTSVPPVCTKEDAEGIIESINVDDNNKEIIVTIKANESDNAKIATITLSSSTVTNGVTIKVGVQGKKNNDLLNSDEFLGWEDEEIDASAISSEEYFLGYEMSVNPMSINSFSYSESARNDVWYLDKIYNIADAEKKYENLSEFEEVAVITLDGISDGVDNISLQNINDYNIVSEGYLDSFEDAEEFQYRIDELNNEIELIDIDIFGLQERIERLNTDLEEVETDSSAYYGIRNEIAQLSEEIETLNITKSNKEKQIEGYETIAESVEETQDELMRLAETIEGVIDCDREYSKTTPLFIYFDYDSSKAYSGATLVTSASEAYAMYKMNDLKTFTTNNEEYIPFEFLFEKDNIACKTKNSKTSEEYYWTVECSELSTEIEMLEFKNKKEFSKSKFDFGHNRDESEYYVKFGGQTFEFKTATNKKTGESKSAKQQAVEFINNNNIIKEFFTKQEFEQSGELYGKIDDAYEYYYYKLVKVDKKDVQDKIKTVLDSEGDDEYIVKKYYENHKFGTLEEFGYGKNYGVIQFFYNGKLHPTGEKYETVQDFIARCDLSENAYERKITDSSISIKTNGVSKYVSSEKTDSSANIEAEIYWDLVNPEYSYPVDNNKKNEKLSEMNYYDMESFGLNSTLEVVKKEMGDDSITFSFGEVYAALKGNKEKEYVLSCERGVLKRVLELDGVELEEKVKEAEERINYLKSVFNPQDGIKNSEITEVLTLGTASSHGSADKNKELSNNREKTIKSFLTTFPIMKDVDMSKVDTDGIETNEIIQVESAFDKDVSEISAKKGRHSRVTIVVGEKDITNRQIERMKQEEERMQQEIKAKKKDRRYDNEMLFFNLLKENDSIAYKRLIDKVKYFSPAFHSITPEGFNARLTFLQQCTRQGPTSTASDTPNGSTASNLAFGRAPYCVLRLGDFLNTKIVITSVNITYPDSMWDLNPEGIGAQFMMAKVSMQIHILGGSDISAPIKRLQNAVSFNYYANTSVYDNRSDHAVYDESSKSIIDTKQWFVELNTPKNTK